MATTVHIPCRHTPEQFSDTILYLRGLLASLIDIIVPRECIACNRILRRDEKYLCIFCASDIPLSRYWNVRKNPMADRLNDLIQKDINKSVLKGQDNSESLGPVKYSYAAALFLYREENGYRKIPQKLKYAGDIHEGRFFARLLGNYLKNSDLFSDLDMIIPVPLHWTREWKRGYNQAAIIAKSLSEITGVPVFEHIIRRNRITKTQTKLSIEEKSANVLNAFSINPKYKSISKMQTTVPAPPRHILLVDDVFTTGSTLHACLGILQRYFGPSTRISAATLGFVAG